MKLNNDSLNVEALAGISEKEFYAIVEGKIDIDKAEAWKKFQKEAEKFRPEKVKEAGK